MINFPTFSFSTLITEVNTGDDNARLKTTSTEHHIQARRTEQTTSPGLLGLLKAIIVKLKTGTRERIFNLLNTHAPEVLETAASPFPKQPSHRKCVPHGPDAGFKCALDAVSHLCTSPLVQQQSFEITFDSRQISVLRDAILDRSVNYTQIQQAVKTRGDLQLVRTLALTLAHDSGPRQFSINAALGSLATAHPNTSVVLGGLMQFAEEAEAGWSDRCENRLLLGAEPLKPEDRFDAGKQQQFLIHQLQAHINSLGDHLAQKTLEPLEGPFGARIRGVIELTVETLSSQVENNNSPEARLLSRLTRSTTLMVDLIHRLRARLDLPLTQVSDALMIEHLNQLTLLERAALVRIGIHPNQFAA